MSSMERLFIMEGTGYAKRKREKRKLSVGICVVSSTVAERVIVELVW